MSITNRSLRFWKQPNWLAVAVVVLICVAVLAFRSFARDHSRAQIAGPDAVETTENPHASIETESVTVTRRGFEPAAITRPQGKFILLVDNRTGSELSFRFSRETGEALHDIRSSRQEPDWNEVVDLRPGRYVLTETDHPSWTCTVVITAN